jgi:AcrR family transcriptional regulator
MVLPRDRTETFAGAAAASLRRRGEVLQRAIYDAALDQLSSVGWKRLTMEGVASCAQTGKAALYRRWASKEALVMAALENTLPLVGEAPDRGSLRDDLVALLSRMRDVMQSPAGCALRAIMEEIEHEHARAFHTMVQQKVLLPGQRISAEVLRRGIERGEVRPDADVELLADVGPAMMMYRAKVCGGAVDPAFPTRVVDQVLMPMLRP